MKFNDLQVQMKHRFTSRRLLATLGDSFMHTGSISDKKNQNIDNELAAY
jgi:hypothetical protein